MYHLAQSLSDVENYVSEGQNEDRNFGWDTETTGLDTRRAKLVGMSLSFKENDAMYIPTGHKLGSNLPVDAVMKIIKKKCDDNYRPLFYNAKYDLNIIQVASKGWAPTAFTDVIELVYLDNPDRKRKGLKLVAKEDLGFEMEKFEDLFSEAERKAKIYDISTKSPVKCTNYACADADATLRVWQSKKHLMVDQAFAIKIDTKLVDIVRKMEHNGGLELNHEYIDTQIKALEERGDALKAMIYRMAGVEFEINSPKKVGDVLFDRMGIPSPGMTRGKNPQHRTDADAMEKLGKSYPIVAAIIAARKVTKAKSTYFEKLKLVDRMGIPIRFNFNIYSAPTFRFSAPGGDPEVDGACGINIQAVSNGESMDLLGVDLGKMGVDDSYLEGMSEEDNLFGAATEDADIDVSKETGPVVEASSLPWTVESESKDESKICFRDTCSGCNADCKIKGVDVTRRMQKKLLMIPSVRQAFQAPEGFSLVSFDYDRQELVIGANLSKEPRWLRALSAGEDLHEMTAAAAFGLSLDAMRSLKVTDPAEYKRKRDIGKTLNFATFYGATAYTLANKADISKAAAEQIFDGFVSGHPVLFAWMSKVHVFARKNGYTTTYFGRKRSLKEYYDDSDRRMQGFADRSAVNTCIQGTAAEVTRIAMVKVQAALEKEQFSSKEVKFGCQIHDELMFVIRDELVQEVSPIIKANMEFKVKSWDVQLTVGGKVGRVWGKQKPLEEFELAA